MSELIEGWFYNKQGQGMKTHLTRTLGGQPDHVLTLCGLVWLKAEIIERTAIDAMKANRPRWLCKRCLKAEPRWIAWTAHDRNGAT